MPATVRPDLPPLVDEAIDAIGNRVRVAVIRSLTRDGPATRTELARRLDVSPSLLQTHLQTLEDLAVVTVNPPRDEPGRLQRTYHANPARVIDLTTALLAAVSEPTATPDPHAPDTGTETAARLTTAQVAERLNITTPTWRTYVARGQAPAADGHFDARTPWWAATTIDDWAARRPRRPS